MQIGMADSAEFDADLHIIRTDVPALHFAFVEEPIRIIDHNRP
jgi:hypothetical protein